jgi:FkbM family methyltransferase
LSLHGRPAIANFGYAYPVFCRQYPTYNQPLVDAVRDRFAQLGRAVRVVDIGAAIGDTVLLVKERCPGAVSEFLCVDGDEEFLDYLRANLGDDADVVIMPAMLSRAVADVPSLVRTHRGTASAVGKGVVGAVTLDALLAVVTPPVDLIKCDVDGFDGAVLVGGRGVLERDRPWVLFEWHPVLYERAGNDPLEPFSVLSDVGYTDFVWFDKYGRAVTPPPATDREALRRLALECLADPAADLHFDVLARADVR